MGEFFKFFRKFLIKAGAQHNGGAAPLFLLLGLEFERFFSALEIFPSLFNVTRIFWSSEDRVKVRFYSVESRQNKPKANHRNLLSMEHTENTEKIKVKETPGERCSSAFSSLIHLL